MKIALLSIFLFSTLSAQVLPFHKGDTAFFSVQQTTILKGEIEGEKQDMRQDLALDFEIKIISLNNKTLSYPFDVEVKFKKISLSSNPQTKTSKANKQFCNYLTHHPLRFSVGEAPEVEETSGIFASETFEDADYQANLLPTLQLILIEIFQLSGEDLILNKKFETSCTQLCHLAGSSLAEGTKMKQSSFCWIDGIGPKTISASWEGNAKITNESMKLSAILNGKILWNAGYPLFQQRTVTTKARVIVPDLMDVDATVYQTLKGKPKQHSAGKNTPRADL